MSFHKLLDNQNYKKKNPINFQGTFAQFDLKAFHKQGLD